MFAMTAITLLCTAGIAFYVRFLVTLCRGCKTRRIRMLGACATWLRNEKFK